MTEGENAEYFEKEQRGADMNEKNQIQELCDEIERYREAIRDAQGALDSAERELDELLSMTYEGACEEV